MPWWIRGWFCKVIPEIGSKSTQIGQPPEIHIGCLGIIQCGVVGSQFVALALEMYSRNKAKRVNLATSSSVRNLTELASIFIARLIRRPPESCMPRQFLNDSLI